MPSTSSSDSSKSCLATNTQTEKPIHYTYLKEFRVEQCPLFLQHKCSQHKPFTCFYWHFMNQRRRRPVRKRDGTFNYSPDVYCTKYDETTGLCPEGEDCPYLHRTAGDTERRYHLRYYKTGVCVYDTDSRGYCVKNGPHCAFAHGIHDLRNPVYDVREIQGLEGGASLLGLDDTSGLAASNGTTPNSLDKERNALNEDPKWQDTNYVLANYKTEPCKRPPRLCRQGYACPQYHNSRDRRRSPKKMKYRSTPCPNVKQSDEWGDPANCENGDACPYCHTRTEQQFHPEIYKSTKCNDIQQTAYCPRGPFCAFAHIDKEMSAVRDINLDNSNSLAAILSSALPTNNHTSTQQPLSGSLDQHHYLSLGGGMGSNGGRPRSFSTSANLHSAESLLYHNKAPGSERENEKEVKNTFSLSSIRRQLHLLDMESSGVGSPSMDSVLDKSRSRMGHLGHMALNSYSNYFPASDTVESVVGNALDDLSLDELNIEASLDKDLEEPLPSLSGSSLLGCSAPVSIPGASLHSSSTSPPPHSPSLGLGGLRTDNSLDKSGFFSSSFGAGFGPFSPNLSPPGRQLAQASSGLQEMRRLRDELAVSRRQLASWGEGIVHARSVCEAWKREAEEANWREHLAEQQRDEALAKISVSPFMFNPMVGPNSVVNDLQSLPLSHLKQIQEQLRSELDKVDQALVHQGVCLLCREANGRLEGGGRGSVLLLPCGHMGVCSSCAPLCKLCPTCNAHVSTFKDNQL